jgi:hypothetical protein
MNSSNVLKMTRGSTGGSDGFAALGAEAFGACLIESFMPSIIFFCIDIIIGIISS